MQTLAKVLADILRCNDSVHPVAHPVFHGYQVRRDGWWANNWHRDGRYVFHAVQLGEINVRWAGETFTVSPGQAVLFGKHAHPDVRWSDHVEVWDLHFSLTGEPESVTHLRDTILKVAAPPEAPGLIDHIKLDILESGSPSPPLLCARLHLLFSLLHEAAREEAEATGVRRLTAGQRLRLVRWVQANLANAPAPGDLAEVCGLSPDYFTRLFKGTFGMSPRDWLIRERIVAARRMLDEDGATVRQAMDATGFNNAAHFSRLMKKVAGVTPLGRRGWRQRPKD